MANINNQMNDKETQVYEVKPLNFNPRVQISAIYVNIGEKLLLLELSHVKAEALAWGMPAGKLEIDELPLIAAQRELFEETGIELAENHFRSLGQLFIRKPDLDYIYHLFEVNLDKIPQVQLSSEHRSYGWVSKQEAESLPLMKGAKQALDYYFRYKNVSQKGIR